MRGQRPLDRVRSDVIRRGLRERGQVRDLRAGAQLRQVDRGHHQLQVIGQFLQCIRQVIGVPQTVLRVPSKVLEYIRDQ